jgi:hypothetical protein
MKNPDPLKFIQNQDAVCLKSGRVLVFEKAGGRRKEVA